MVLDVPILTEGVFLSSFPRRLGEKGKVVGDVRGTFVMLSERAVSERPIGTSRV